MERGLTGLLLLFLLQQTAGAIDPEGIFHDPGDIFYVNPKSGDIRLKVSRNNIERASIIIGTMPIEMNIALHDEAYDYYAIQLKAFDSTLSYKFLLTADPETLTLPAEGSFRPTPMPLMVPEWPAGKVYYCISVDGFYNGNRMNDPGEKNEWGAEPTDWLPYGGDLAGIIQRRDYINSLRVDVVLLSPLFLAASNHKLDPLDYATIDPAYGDTTDLKNLIDMFHDIGKKVVLSIVLTHTSDDFPAFADIKNKGSASRYVDWYKIQSLPSTPAGFKFLSWRSDPRFPLLNLRNRQLQTYLIGFIDYWAHFGCDGFYIGETEIDEYFARTLYDHVKTQHPDLLLINGDPHRPSPYAADGHYDREFSQSIIDYFVNGAITTTEFDSIIHQKLFFNPAQINRNNLVGALSHTKRIGKITDDSLLELMYAFMFTFCGSPIILYGDEVGMSQCTPLNWGSFPWEVNRQDRILQAKIRSLIEIRRTHAELTGQSFYTLYIDEVKKVYAYDRGGVVVVLNCGPAQSFVELPAWDGTYTELLTGSKFTAYSNILKLSVDPVSYRILKRGI
jgi:cyclomaltodextrinase